MDQLCHLNEIPDEGCKGLSWNDKTLIAIRRKGQLYLYLNRCPHRGIPLEWQPDQFLDFERQYIQCSTHGALFQIDSGRCIQGPCQGQSLEAVNFNLIDQHIFILDNADD